MKNERLKKLETELADLQQWLKLGLVPKKEIQRHNEEIETLTARIEEEKERLQFLKESGDLEEFSAPRRTPAKQVYADTPTMSDIEVNEEATEGGIDIETETMDLDAEDDKEEGSTEEHAEEEEEEDPFSDRNRWRRGGIIDPDATEW